MKQKILTALLALLAAFAMWLYVITVENPEAEMTFYNIPVVLENESALTERSLMVMNSKTPTVTLKLSGTRSQLNKLNSSNITLVADLSKIYNTGEQSLTYEIQFPGDIPQNSIEVLSQLPAQVNLMIVARDSKEVPVNLIIENQDKITAGHKLLGEKLSHNEIHVEGPASVVHEIHEARVVVDVAGRKDPVNQNYRYTFYDKNGNPVSDNYLITNTPEVNVNLDIYPYKNVPVVLGNTIYDSITNADNAKVTCGVKYITLAGREELLAGIEKISLGDIDLNNYPASTTIYISLKQLLNDGLTVVEGWDKIPVTIERPERKSVSYMFTKIQTVNLPEGLKVDFVNAVQAEFQGRADEIDIIESGDMRDIRVYVDLSGATVGTREYTVTFEINGFETVTVTKTYTVSVTIAAE